MIKVLKFKKLKGGKKKYEITFEKNGKTYVRKFGAQGMSDFTIHKDRERRERYISRHKKDLRTNDPMKPGYLSMYILWNKPTLKASLADYKRRLNIYNKTGKFPTGISGSKKLSFGATDPCSAEALTNLPWDVQEIVKQQCAAGIIQSVGKKMDPKRSLFEALKIRGLKRYQDAAKRTSNPRENSDFINQLWTNLDPVNDFTARWLTRASEALIKSDFDFKTRNFWWKIVENQIASMSEIEEDLGDPSEELSPNEYVHYEKCQGAIMVILNKVGYPITDNDIDEGWAQQALMWWKNKKTNTFGKKKTLFGMKNSAEIKDILADKVRWDPAQLILEYTAVPELQKLARGYLARSFVKSKRYLKMILLAINIDYYRRRRVANPEQRAQEEMEPDSGTPWEALDAKRYETAFFLQRCVRILTESDKTDTLWYNCMFTVLNQLAYLDPEYNRYSKSVSDNIESCVDSIVDLLPVLTEPTVYPDVDEPRWYTRTLIEIEENEQENQFGKKNKTGGSKIPDNVVNKTLYASIKAKIRRSIKGRRWGAYDSGRLVREYKATGGRYSGKKGKTDLGRWYKEKWVDACAWPKRKSCGRKTKEKIAYCRPSKRVDSKTPKLVQKLTKAQIKSRCAKKKKNPMKRVTKFGRQTSDEPVAWGDGGWAIHCNYYPWGAHSTIRYKPLAERPGDYSYHYGIHNNGTLTLWATGRARNTPIPRGLRTILINYYNNRCGGNMTFGTKNQELIDKMRQQMFKQLMSAPDVNTRIQNTIIKRCKRGFSDSFCQDIFTQLLLSMYFTVVSKSKITPARQNNLKEMESFIPANFKPTMLNINKNHFSKIDEMLYLLQDHAYGNFKNARIASLLYEYIQQK